MIIAVITIIKHKKNKIHITYSKKSFLFLPKTISPTGKNGNAIVIGNEISTKYNY